MRTKKRALIELFLKVLLENPTNAAVLLFAVSAALFSVSDSVNVRVSSAPVLKTSLLESVCHDASPSGRGLALQFSMSFADGTIITYSAS